MKGNEKKCRNFWMREVNDKEMPIAPCGNMANVMFNDTFILQKYTSEKGVFETVSWKETGIAFPEEVKYLYR